jgi:hypothetical protein
MLGIDARGVQLRDLKLRRLERFVYEYDFGDSWIHDLRLEATLPVDPRKTYPVCVAGKCSAPPEDCGGRPRLWQIVSPMLESAAAHRPRSSTISQTNSMKRRLTFSATITRTDSIDADALDVETSAGPFVLEVWRYEKYLGA